MSMIAAQQGKWFARVEIKDEGDGWEEPEPTYLEVVAWDDEGHAMVVNAEAGCLRKASEMSGFSGLATAFEKDTFVESEEGEETGEEYDDGEGGDGESLERGDWDDVSRVRPEGSQHRSTRVGVEHEA